ncbi:MAG: hypothetical protein M9897_09505 [Brumimicrobium sp.]|nr:hypothetical protein [Brumimicrobium sp.]
MKKFLVFTIIVMISYSFLCQENKKRLSINIDEFTNLRMFKKTSGLYASFENLILLNTGIDFSSDNMGIYLSYGLNSNLSRGQITKPFMFNSHMLGIKYSYSILNRERKIHPLITIGILREITSSYKNKFLDENYFTPVLIPLKNDHFSGSHGGYSGYHNSSFFYITTPLYIYLDIGINFKINKYFAFKLSTGYAMQLLKYKYLKWTPEQDYSEMLKNTSTKNQIFHIANINLGLSYSFPLNSKKEK